MVPRGGRFKGQERWEDSHFRHLCMPHLPSGVARGGQGGTYVPGRRGLGGAKIDN